MKQSKQQLRRQLSRPGVGWVVSKWLRGRRWLGRRWAVMQQFSTKNNWQVVFGTGVGVLLVAAACGVLLSYAKPPLPLVKKFGDNAEVRQQFQEALTSDYYHTPEFTKQLSSATLPLQKQDSQSIRKLPIQKLLKVRNESLAYVRYLLHLREQRRDSLLLKLDWMHFATKVEYKNLWDESDRLALLGLQTDSLLAELELPLLPVIAMSERELAQARLKYLTQRVHAYPPFSSAAWQRDLAQLQLRDARHAELTQAALDSLRQAELTLGRAIELRRSELTTASEKLTARFLDSCHYELSQLQLLDSCRQDLAYWFPDKFGKAYPSVSLEDHIKIPQGYSKLTDSSLNKYQPPSVGSGISVMEVVIATFLLTLLVSPVIGGASLFQLRRQLRAGPVALAPEVEPPVLQALLLAYADTIREVLLMPRKIKRFAGKVRLQYYLLATLSQEQIRTESQFKFGPTEQVLAFLLLLLIEQRTQRTHAPLKNVAEFRQQVLADYQEALTAGRFETAAANQLFSCQQGVVRLQINQDAGLEKEVIVVLAKALKGADVERLLMQLHWLNAGLLV